MVEKIKPSALTAGLDFGVTAEMSKGYDYKRFSTPDINIKMLKCPN